MMLSEVRRLSLSDVAVGFSTVITGPVRTRDELVKLEMVLIVIEDTESVVALELLEVLCVTLISSVEDGSFVLFEIEASLEPVDVAILSSVVNLCVLVLEVFFASSFEAFVGSGVGLGVFLELSVVALTLVDFGFFDVRLGFFVAFAFFLVLFGFLDFGFFVFFGGAGSATSPDLAFLGPKARHLEKRGHSLD
jgi:hypothetical protein